MFRDSPKLSMNTPSVNCIFMNGGVGDHVASLVAVDYILKNYHWVNLLIWVPDMLLDFAKNVLPARAIVRDYSSMRKHYDQNKPTITTQWEGRHSPMKTHCLDYAFHMLCDESPGVEAKNYLQINRDKIDITGFSLPERYITIATGFTANVREFTPEAVNGVVAYAKSKGYETVFLGQKTTPTGGAHKIKAVFDEAINYSAGVDLIDQTTLLQAAKIIDGSKAMVGVDCGLMHVAGCTNVAIVGGFTTVNPELRWPVRNDTLGFNCYPVLPDEDLGCRFCQVRTNFLYGHDYKNCLYASYPDADRACVRQLTVEKFVSQLERIL